MKSYAEPIKTNYATTPHRTTIPGIAIIFTTIVAIIIGIPVIIIRLRKAPLYSEAIDWIVGQNAMDPNAADYNYSSISTENTAAKMITKDPSIFRYHTKPQTDNH